jgi:hypothetical protein
VHIPAAIFTLCQYLIPLVLVARAVVKPANALARFLAKISARSSPRWFNWG